MFTLPQLLVVLLYFAQNKPISAGVCSASCNCSSENVPQLDNKEYFILRCSDELVDVSNASLADVFYYKASGDSVIMDSNILHRFYNLKFLSIDGGVQSLSSIPEIVSLRILEIMHTSISYLPEQGFASISGRLTFLSLTFSDLEAFSNDAFAGLDYLETLNLSHNGIEKVSSALLSNLNALQILDLSFNNIRSVSSSDFAGLKFLRRLNLDNNNIYSLSFIAFSNSGVSLSVQGNPLSILSWQGNTKTRLSSLRLGGNSLTLLQKKTFVNVNIETISITSSDKLRLIDREAFVNVTVANISITNNSKLEYIDPQIFKNVKNLRHIDISFNKLRIVPRALSRLPSIESIVAMGNPLLCDCNIRWIGNSDSKVNIDSSCTSQKDTTKRLPTKCLPRLVYRSNNVTTIDEGLATTLRCKVGSWYCSH